MDLWEEIVNEELDFQLLSDFGSRNLTLLFQSKVKDLSRARRTAVQNEITNQMRNTTIQPMRPKNSAMNINNDPVNISNNVKIPYDEWPGYRRGQDMYSDLSEAIHGSGKKYEFPANELAKVGTAYSVLAQTQQVRYRRERRGLGGREGGEAHRLNISNTGKC